jgi:predicted transcriptional regulator of viral defense system
MPAQPLTPARLRKSGLGAFFRPRDIEPLGITFPELQRLVSEGTIEKVGPGLYRLAAAKPDELETIAMVASAIPAAIVCLLSALRIHNIGTQAPPSGFLRAPHIRIRLRRAADTAYRSAWRTRPRIAARRPN